MKQPKLSRLELRIMEVLWARGVCSIREIQEGFPEKSRPAYSTIQTLVYRLQAKKALRRAKKVSNAYMFEAAISRHAAQSRLIDDFLDLFGGVIQPVMIHLVEKEKLTLEVVQQAEKLLHEAARRKKP